MSRKRKPQILCSSRQMTPKEMAETEQQTRKEQERYRINIMIGGIDSRGNYTALHHRWEESRT